MLTAASIAALVGPRLAVAFRDHYKSVNLGDPNLNLALQYNDFFYTGSAVMVSAIMCNIFIKDMTKTTEAMAVTNKIKDLDKEIRDLQFNLRQIGIEMKEKEQKILKLDNFKDKFMDFTKTGKLSVSGNI